MTGSSGYTEHQASRGNLGDLFIRELQGKTVTILTLLPGGQSYMGTIDRIYADSLVVVTESGPVLVYKQAIGSIRESSDNLSRV